MMLDGKYRNDKWVKGVKKRGPMRGKGQEKKGVAKYCQANLM